MGPEHPHEARQTGAHPPGAHPTGAHRTGARPGTARPRTGLVARYTILSAAGVVAGLVAYTLLFQRFSEDLVDRLTGERLEAQIAATANTLQSFLDARSYQLATLSNHPALPAFIVAPDSATAEEMQSLIRVEADSPDLYGILFLDRSGRLVRMVPGQAASGPPYWSPARALDLSDLPVSRRGEVEIVGPRLPDDLNSGWILMRQQVRATGTGGAVSIALHVRLASLTELMARAGVGDLARPLLRIPGGEVLDATGRPVADPGTLTEGPEILPGWRLMVDLRPGEILEPAATARRWLVAMAALTLIGVLAAFLALSRRLRRRVETLVAGAARLAAGDLDTRLPEGRRPDEISLVARAFNAMADELRALITRTVRAENLAVLGRFATGVAHEVRNPLATIKLSVQSLARSEKDAERRALLEDMGGQIDRLNRVVGDLLAYGRPGEPRPATVRVRTLLRSAAALLEAPAAERGVRVVMGGDSRLALHADADQIIQVLLNLGMNAVQASEPGGVVALRARAAGAMVELSVEDHGCGIPEAHLLDVLQPFFTMKSKGTGLGLTICQQLTEANRGTLSIESAPQEGTTITLALPAATPGGSSEDPTDAEGDFGSHHR